MIHPYLCEDQRTINFIAVEARACWRAGTAYLRSDGRGAFFDLFGEDRQELDHPDSLRVHRRVDWQRDLQSTLRRA